MISNLAIQLFPYKKNDQHLIRWLQFQICFCMYDFSFHFRSFTFSIRSPRMVGIPFAKFATKTKIVFDIEINFIT